MFQLMSFQNLQGFICAVAPHARQPDRDAVCSAAAGDSRVGRVSPRVETWGWRRAAPLTHWISAR